MKKGFTMIELIFVIVILGILASVAIPRLAATREDAEISAAVANLRTLVSDASAYYTAKGEFPSTAKWSEITNVPVDVGSNTNAVSSSSSTTTATAHLKVGGKDCIGVALVNKNGNAAAHIKFIKNSSNSSSGVCKEVLGSAPVKAYIESKVPNGSSSISEAIVVGSSTSVYQTTSQTTQNNRRQ